MRVSERFDSSLIEKYGSLFMEQVNAFHVLTPAPRLQTEAKHIIDNIERLTHSY